jgi:hypothetical protein
VTKLLGSFALAALATAVTTQTLKANSTLCVMGDSVMSGTYVMSGTGNIVGLGPVVVVGEVVYNGDGTGVLMSATENVNGAVVRLSMVPAIFTVNRDCTGSKTVGTGSSAEHFDFLITPDGSTITWVETDANAVISGTAVRIGFK